MGVIRLCDEMFEGPLDIDAPGVQHDVAGVFAIICNCHDGAKRMVDVGHSPSMDRNLTNPENHKRWRKPYQGPVTAYIWRAPQPDDPDVREALARKIRERYHPMCARKTPNASR